MMKPRTYTQLLFLLCISLVGCEDYLKVDLPDNRITSTTVFNDQETAESAVQGVYNELSRAYFAAGGPNSVTVLAGLSADHLITTVNTQTIEEFEQNEISVQNAYNYNIWSSAYNLIYQTNAVIEGIEASNKISQDSGEQMMGEARCIRAFVYFYLTNLYGEVPLVLTTDYRNNATVSRSPEGRVYAQIIEDLEVAEEYLSADQSTGPLKVNANTARALLARVSLYRQDWGAAESWSTALLESGMYQLEEEPNDVFLVNSTEAIWQISPESTGSGALHTREGNFFILVSPPNSLNPVALSPQLLDLFSEDDLRAQQWINSFTGETGTFYYPFKYKVSYATTGEVAEYSMVMRLAEQYLIRAEARLQRGDLAGAIDDLNQVRERSHLSPLGNTGPNISASALQDSIVLERRRELFTEWGHRWLDLKRLGKTTAVLAPQKAIWEHTDELYPLAEEELMKNRNLTQNPGY